MSNISEGGILKQDNTKRCQTTLDVLSIARDTKFPCFYIQLEQVFSRAPTMGDFPGTLDSEERFVSDIIMRLLHPYEFCSCEKRLLSALSQNESLLMHLEESFGNMVSFTAKENLLVTLRYEKPTSHMQMVIFACTKLVPSCGMCSWVA